MSCIKLFLHEKMSNLFLEDESEKDPSTQCSKGISDFFSVNLHLNMILSYFKF